MIAIPGLKGREPKEISEKNLALIIQARTEEILDYVVWHIKRSGFEKKLIGGIVLTGGGALLKDIDKLTEFHTGMTARVGIPAEHLAHGNSERVYSPIFATGIGLLLRGIEAVETGKVTYTHKEPEVVAEETPEEMYEQEPMGVGVTEEGGKWYSQLFKKTKEWFEAEPDTEY